MTDDEYQPVAISRRISAPARDIFQVLANPVRHLELDGSGSLRGAVSATMISGVGDVFVIPLGHRWSYQLTPDGQDATVVTEIYDCSRAPEEERVLMDNGNIWAESMAKTLERLDALCARPGNQPNPS